MNHNTATIRKLLTAAFTDEDLTAFCFDHFREIYHKFGRGLTHSEKVQLLLEYCETNQSLQHATDNGITLRRSAVPKGHFICRRRSYFQRRNLWEL